MSSQGLSEEAKGDGSDQECDRGSKDRGVIVGPGLYGEGHRHISIRRERPPSPFLKEGVGEAVADAEFVDAGRNVSHVVEYSYFSVGVMRLGERRRVP